MIDYELRYPKGNKTISYYRSRVEKFAPYHIHDGLILRITQYKDSESEIHTHMWVAVCGYAKCTGS